MLWNSQTPLQKKITFNFRIDFFLLLPEHSEYREDGTIVFRGSQGQHQRRPLEIVKTRKIKIFHLRLSCSDLTDVDPVFYFEASKCWVHSDSEAVVKSNPRNFSQDVGALDGNVNIVYCETDSIVIVYFLVVLKFMLLVIWPLYLSHNINIIVLYFSYNWDLNPVTNLPRLSIVLGKTAI